MLTQFLVKRFVRNYEAITNVEVRLNYGILGGYVGICVNFLLFLLKLSVGILSGSVSVAADAINNLSDAGSGIVTIIGFKISGKPADSDHPFGHGRVEYIAGVVVSIIIISMGFDFLKESIMRIFKPHSLNMSWIMLGVVGSSLLFKAWLFFFFRYLGKKISSQALIAAAFDSLSDMLGTSVIILAISVEKFWGIGIDGYAGGLVSILLLFGGVKVLRDTINPLLGEPPSSEFVSELRAKILSVKGITGVHDIIIHNYGPNQYFATAHAEVDLDGDLLAVHDLLESTEVMIGQEMPVHLLLHCDPCNTFDPEISSWRVKLEQKVAEFDNKFKVYDFRLRKSEERIILNFHMLIPRNYYLSCGEIQKSLSEAMQEYSGQLELQIEFMNSYV
ncbi:MAG: cation transporter [Lentisphaeria bacterium]|nr:cation transporter [Lentisphaeria bacterium]